MRDTLRAPPRSSLLPPPLPTGVAPYPEYEHATGYDREHITIAEVALATLGVAAAASALYLGAELAHHWQIGGWAGVAWLAGVLLAAALVGSAVTLAVAMRGLRRGE